MITSGGDSAWPPVSQLCDQPGKGRIPLVWAECITSDGRFIFRENHLNMMMPTVVKPVVSPALLAGFLNSAAADRAFRCLSGSVAVSAYELESLPLPAADDLLRLVDGGIDRGAIDAAAARLYGLAHPARASHDQQSSRDRAETEDEFLEQFLVDANQQPASGERSE